MEEALEPEKEPEAATPEKIEELEEALDVMEDSELEVSETVNEEADETTDEMADDSMDASDNAEIDAEADTDTEVDIDDEVVVDSDAMEDVVIDEVASESESSDDAVNDDAGNDDDAVNEEVISESETSEKTDDEEVESAAEEIVAEDGAVEETESTDQPDSDPSDDDPFDGIESTDEPDSDPSDDESEISAEFAERGLTTEACVEAILFASSSPVNASKMAKTIECEAKLVVQCIEKLNEQYEAQGRTFRIKGVANGYQMMTRTKYFPVIQKMVRTRTSDKLTQAGLETLAIIAYKQPITRADVEAVRGVQSGAIIRNLLERRLVRVVGRDSRLGHPMLYGTSKRFLEIFGLKTLKELPSIEELKAF